MILILTKPDDSHTEAVTREFDRRGVEYDLILGHEFPLAGCATLTFPSEQHFWRSGGREMRLDRATSVWNRRQEWPSLKQIVDDEQRRFAQQESYSFYFGIWEALSDRFWANAPSAAFTARMKPPQLRLAAALGLEIPETVMSNDPDHVRAFCAASPGPFIYKPFKPFFVEKPEAPGRGFSIFANLMTGAEVLESLESIQMSPCIFQKYIEKRLELRVSIVGSHVFCAAIHSQKSKKEKSRVDWRRYDFEDVTYEQYDLPEVISGKLLELFRRMGLVFGCVDMIVTPDDRYVFLEVNESGQWLWIEHRTGFPIAAHIAQMLIEGKADFASPPNVPLAATSAV